MSGKFDALHPSDNLFNFFSCLPFLGLGFTVGRLCAIEGVVSAILKNDFNDNSADARKAEALNLTKKIDLIRHYGDISIYGGISGVTTVILFIALAVLGILPIGVAIGMSFMGVTFIAISSIQTYRINKFIRSHKGNNL